MSLPRYNGILTSVAGKFHSRSPTAMIGHCDPACAAKKWRDGPVCGVPGCEVPAQRQRSTQGVALKHDDLRQYTLRLLPEATAKATSAFCLDGSSPGYYSTFWSRVWGEKVQGAHERRWAVRQPDELLLASV